MTKNNFQRFIIRKKCVKSKGYKMKIQKINQTIANYKRLKHQKELNRIVDLSGAFGDAGKELYRAWDILANYAKAKNIHMSFNNMLMNDYLHITVTNKEGLAAENIISGKTDQVTTVVRERKCFLENKDGCNYIGHGIESHEDTFLRSVYRTVEALTYSLTKK